MPLTALWLHVPPVSCVRVTPVLMLMYPPLSVQVLVMPVPPNCWAPETVTVRVPLLMVIESLTPGTPFGLQMVFVPQSPLAPSV